ncbi:MAG: phosphoethanolamine transferase, partial [Nitrosomonadales bacterium]|nr:phosphoethanolamine transferase [Nitrosomonadales bacterium]
LSLEPITQLENMYSRKSIVSAFAESGFKTYWLSTQELDSWAGFTRVISYDADSTYYFERSYDDVVLEKLRNVLNEPYQRKLIVIHLRASHWEYVKRYPAEFNIFKPADSSWREHLIASYDNSILYTDYIMDAIIKKVAELPIRSFIFHASDHGENLLDDDRQIFGHPFGTEHDLEIPAYIWFSDHAAKQLNGKLQAAARNSDMPINSNNLAHSMIDIAGIHTPHLDYSKSLFSESFRVGDRMYVMPDKTLHAYVKPPPPEYPLLMSVWRK